NPIRAYPILPFICFLEVMIVLRNRSLPNLYQSGKILAILFLPFILFFGVMGASAGGPFYGGFLGLVQKTTQGNLQLLLTPITTMGSLFLVGDILRFIRPMEWNLNSSLSFFLGAPLVVLGLLTALISVILSKKPVRFFFTTMLVNFLLEIILFIVVSEALNLPAEIRMHYDPDIYATPAILGIYIISLTISITFEWFKDKKNIFLSLYLLGIILAVIFIWFTWFLQDFSTIPIGINGYSTIPSLGISVAIASILMLLYTTLKNHQAFRSFAPCIFLILIPFFIFSNNQIQIYLQRNLNYGNRAKDQIDVKNKFWSFIKKENPCDKLFYFDNLGKSNGYNFSFILLDRFYKWYSLYSPYQSKIPCSSAYLIGNKNKLLQNYISSPKRGFYAIDADGARNFYSLENFYAFRMDGKDIVNIREDILKELD
ncbi:MAG: hypothetical protein M1308_15965, partial [Actinobacteria bacterium]|nr:hypothetical protein [Actinomycetota bacterium]